ncbi:putative cinnamyl alcohol dehydrogenase 6 [Triticum urartu]|uniref:cinnamyl-alcohol dehydrogenase n=1 Tax=Triticum urartu TaxID=4572 RepID=M7YKV4_TRIUA|nr:putative cinnamyl alcohol dehydrogenase 6 [Triticum urartu]
MEVTPKHTQAVSGWAAMEPSGEVVPFAFKRRENGVDDVTIKVHYCGMCHTDLHFINNDWGITMYPLVPGHEITGVVTRVGANVSGFRPGDRVGVGLSTVDPRGSGLRLCLQVRSLEHLQPRLQQALPRRFCRAGVKKTAQSRPQKPVFHRLGPKLVPADSGRTRRWIHVDPVFACVYRFDP